MTELPHNYNARILAELKRMVAAMVKAGVPDAKALQRKIKRDEN
jgi:hypothetical protein